MYLDSSQVAIFVTVLISLVAMGVAWGTLREKVKGNRIDLDDDRKQNREDHQRLFDKLSEINKCLAKMNGKK